MALHYVAITATIFLTSSITNVYGQRPLWPEAEFDMSMYDAAELCHQMDIDKANGSAVQGTAANYLPDGGRCYFFQWIYCPNVPENLKEPCGWWEQKLCKPEEARVGHFARVSPNPYGLLPSDPKNKDPTKNQPNGRSIVLPRTMDTEIKGGSGSQSPSHRKKSKKLYHKGAPLSDGWR